MLYKLIFICLFFNPQMNKTLLDDTLLQPVADICAIGDNLIVSVYDSTLRIYLKDKLHHSIHTQIPFTKICGFKSKIIAISHTTGNLSIFDSSLNVIGTMEGPKQACFLHSFKDFLLLGTLNKEIFILKETEGALFAFHQKIENTKTPTAISSSDESVAISFENTLKVYDCEFKEIYSKDLTVCITSLQFYYEMIIIGLINGKIQVENTKNTDESFLFNSHVANSTDKKILYPVTHLEKGAMLISSGYDGKVLKWDLLHKKMVSCIFESKMLIRKFLIKNGSLYVLAENETDSNSLYYLAVANENI